MNKVRIIGGQWRSRVIKFESTLALRPTPDRVRETLFNWLSHHIVDARCLDLFAGSGALGFEALSRGASQVVAVESESRVARSLVQNKANLGADGLSVFCQSFPFEVDWEPFDIVFLDPPYQKGLYEPALAWLIDNHLLKEDAFVYIESNQPMCFPNWVSVKLNRAGQVHFGLFKPTS